MSKRSTTLIGAAVALALLKQAAPVQAQSTQSNDIEEVVVTGIRASLRESMETKREAVGVVDALTAEDVGKFPDKNLAEALRLASTEYESRKDIFTCDTLAWALFKNGRVAEAKKVIKEALRTGSKDQRINEHAARINQS